MSEQKAHTKRMRQLICDTMISLLEEKPFSKITVQDILNRAEIQRATFYRYFHDKYEVVESINHFLADSYARHFFQTAYQGQGIDYSRLEKFQTKYAKVTKCMLFLQVENINLLKNLEETFLKEYQNHYPDSTEYEAYLAAHNFISAIVWHSLKLSPPSAISESFYSDAQIRWLAHYHNIPVSKFSEFIEQNRTEQNFTQNNP